MHLTLNSHVRLAATIIASAAMDDTEILLIRSHHSFVIELVVLYFIRLTTSHYAFMKKFFNRNITHMR